jgi:hypothetical protein
MACAITDDGSHWRRCPHAIRIEPFPSGGRVYTGDASKRRAGTCWSVCGGDNPSVSTDPSPARRPRLEEAEPRNGLVNVLAGVSSYVVGVS